jgi:hypothetical protein
MLPMMHAIIKGVSSFILISWVILSLISRRLSKITVLVHFNASFMYKLALKLVHAAAETNWFSRLYLPISFSCASSDYGVSKKQ